MAAWLTVYCARPVRHVTGKDLLLGLDFEDPYTFAEAFEIDDEGTVDEALANLRVEPRGDEGGFAIRYRPGNSRPLLLHFWDDPVRVAEEVAEARESLTGARGRGPTRIRQHLARTVEVAALELGWSQTEDMGIVLASRTTDLLAAVGDGLIVDQNENWWALGKGGSPELIYPRN